MSQFDCGPGQYGGKQQRCQRAEQRRAGAQAHAVCQVDHRIQDHGRRHQRDGDRGGPVAQGGQHEHDQHHERDDDADQRPQSAPPGDRDDHHREGDGQPDQRPRPLVVVERVGRGAGRVDLAGHPDLVTDRELRLARPAAELQQRVGALVRTGVDRDERLHAVGTVALGGHRWGRQHRSHRLVAAGRRAAGHHVAGLGGDRTARGVLERQRDVDLLLARPEPCRPGQGHDADGDQQSDDDLGGERSQRRWSAQGMRMGV